ncbi:MAG TPA: TolC family protein [Cyclobacteriaceae bacterium]|nr:TolC family protein [Cyclobacteriaceae bacterium]HMV89290.1 TolC family protein [Cyclobacteriaceae bacterium]HMX00380.1 TolC family protein [Cyclobacteriaceae bacterium]HMX49621.1 TolC family protein [Cyclobacteriaceae bacterium]HMY93200.1 TolC family protein [Cyclobacteriaceae bacterium]
MKRILLVFFAAFFSVSTFAQIDTTARKWTLREIIDYAIAHNLTVKRSEYAVETGEVNALQAKAALLPTVNASASYGYNWGRTIDPSSNSFTENRVKSVNMNASSSLLLWNGFRLFYNVRQTDTELEALSEDLIKSRNDVILSVITLYINVVFNKELYNVAKLQLRSTEEQLLRTRKLAEAGSVPQANVLNLEAQFATNELNLIQRENAVNLTLLQLKQALQLPAATPLDVELPQIDLNANDVVNKTPEEIYEIATSSMPEIKAARLRRKGALFALRSTQGNFYPRLTMTGTLSTVYSDQRLQFQPDGTTGEQVIGYIQGSPSSLVVVPSANGTYFLPGYSDQFQNNLGKSLGFSLQIPIFNGLSTRSAVQRAKISRNLAEISLTENENRLRQTVETAYNDAVSAIKTYNSAQKQVRARDEAYRMTKIRLDNGAVNYVEYQVAENDLFQAQSDLLRAKYDFIFRKKVLDFYQGLPLGL